MSTLVSISAGTREKATNDLDAERVTKLSVVVISPHNQCNCRCMMCDIWRIRDPKELKPSDLEPHVSALRELDVRWVVFTGGEPQLNSQLFLLAAMLREIGIRTTMLTAGLLLESQAQAVGQAMDDVTVSLDGPANLHDKIRRVPGAFERITAGIRALRQVRPAMPVRGRCTVQKANHHALLETIQAARKIGLDSISFLAADATSAAFNRPEGWAPEKQGGIMLSVDEIGVLESEIEQLIREGATNSKSSFVEETPAKLRRIVTHFRAHVGQAEHVAPRCNAPWVSAVIEASGEVRPCFFHPVIGNIRQHPLAEIINGDPALQFRSQLDVPTNPICRRCVCSLYIPTDK